MDIISVKFEGWQNIVVSFNWITIIILFLLILFISLGIKWMHKKAILKTVTIEEATIGIGNSSVTIKYDGCIKEIAYKIWIELTTRKIGLKFDEKYDIISEVYDSWYEAFKVIRTLLANIPANRISDAKGLIDITTKVLNNGLRPHLTAWQAKYRAWYNSTLSDATATPQEIQRTYPEYQLFEETVYKDIAFGPKNMGLSAEEVDRRVREAAGFVGLTEQQLEVSPFDLSGGQKRRVAIAGVIAMEPEVLILDEPTAGLDPVGRSEILGNIQSYRKAKNATIMMVSHSMEDVARLTDRLLVMNGSKLAMDAPPAQVFTHAEELTQMGLNIPQVTQVFLELKKLGLDVKNVYTIEQAAAEIRRLKGGNCHA